MNSPDPMPWHAITSREVYRNPWLALREDRVRLPDGEETTYGVVTCGAAVGVLPFLDGATVLLVRQYRYVAGRVTWEMPTGGADPQESLTAAAQRELAEEAGHRAGRLEHVSSFHTSKSVVDETAHLYFGYDLSPVAAASDATEFLTRHHVAFDRAVEWVLSGEIVDSMTVVALLHADRQRAR